MRKAFNPDHGPLTRKTGSQGREERSVCAIYFVACNIGSIKIRTP